MQLKVTRLVWLSTLVLFGCSDAPQPTSPQLSEVAVARSVAPGAALGTTASRLIVSIPDAMGDMYPGTSIDVSRFDLLFDRTTGAYEITVGTYASGPFVGTFRINVNFYNIDALSFFQRTYGNTFTLAGPVSVMKLTGTAPLLTLWQPGHRVNTNSLFPLAPLPPNSTMFRSQVWALPTCGFLCGEDLIAFPIFAQPAIVEVFSTTDEMNALQDAVAVLLAEGVLTADQADGLLTKLAAILEKIANGQTKAAKNQLSAFVNQVNAFVNAGVLTAAQAQPLLNGAAYAASQL